MKLLDILVFVQKYFELTGAQWVIVRNFFETANVCILTNPLDWNWSKKENFFLLKISFLCRGIRWYFWFEFHKLWVGLNIYFQCFCVKCGQVCVLKFCCTSARQTKLYMCWTVLFLAILHLKCLFSIVTFCRICIFYELLVNVSHCFLIFDSTAESCAAFVAIQSNWVSNNWLMVQVSVVKWEKRVWESSIAFLIFLR